MGKNKNAGAMLVQLTHIHTSCPDFQSIFSHMSHRQFILGEFLARRGAKGHIKAIRACNNSMYMHANRCSLTDVCVLRSSHHIAKDCNIVWDCLHTWEKPFHFLSSVGL